MKVKIFCGSNCIAVGVHLPVSGCGCDVSEHETVRLISGVIQRAGCALGLWTSCMAVEATDSPPPYQFTESSICLAAQRFSAQPIVYVSLLVDDWNRKWTDWQADRWTDPSRKGWQIDWFTHEWMDRYRQTDEYTDNRPWKDIDKDWLTNSQMEQRRNLSSMSNQWMHQDCEMESRWQKQ